MSGRAGGTPLIDLEQLDRDLDGTIARLRNAGSEDAVEVLRGAVSSLSRVRKYLPLCPEYEALLQRHRPLYEKFVFAAFAAGRPELAIECVETLRDSAVYTAVLDRLPGHPRESEVGPLLAELKQVRERIWAPAGEANLQDLHRHDALVHEISQRFPGVWTEVPHGRGMDLGFKEAMRIKLNVMIWGVFERISFWALFRPPRPTLINMMELGELHLAEIVRRIRAIASRPGTLSAAARKELAQLSRGLGIHKLEAGIAPDTSLCIVPHGQLHFLPFCVLGTEQHLAETHSISYAPSIRSISENRHEARLRGRRALLVAFSPGDSLLPAVVKEVEAVKSHMSENVLLAGADAHPERVAALASHFDILHFACHSSVRPDRWTESVLRLAPFEDGTGMLTAVSVLGFRLNADLVVLSACDTALGELAQYDQVAGLSLAFLYAGAGAVLSSLWRIPDEETAELMEAFYAKIDKGVRFDEGLRAAQCDLIRRGKGPGSWGAFTLMGYYPDGWRIGSARWAAAGE